MIFFYSRKVQGLMLICWLVGILYMLAQVTYVRPRLLAHRAPIAASTTSEVRLGKIPEAPAQQVQLPKEPTLPARPAPDPHINRLLSIRAIHANPEQLPDQHREGAVPLVLEMDFVPASQKGFTIEKTSSYYLADQPAFVIALGVPWKSDISHLPPHEAVPHVKNVELVVSKSDHLRIIVHTSTMTQARDARLETAPTATGMRAIVHLPK